MNFTLVGKYFDYIERVPLGDIFFKQGVESKYWGLLFHLEGNLKWTLNYVSMCPHISAGYMDHNQIVGDVSASDYVECQVNSYEM